MAGTEMQREPTRNRLMRRADFRFLLPNPRPERTICFAGGRLRQAVETISLSVEDPHGRPPAAQCDLAVAVDPDRALLAGAWRALRPGGSCYVEWYSPLAGGPLGVRRRLEAAGFADVSCYWAWPLPALGPVQFWLPLEVPGVTRYFLTHRPALTGLRRLRHCLLRRAWLLVRRLGVIRPICAVAHKPATGEDPPASRTRPPASAMPDDLASLVRSGWPAWDFGPPPKRLAWLLLTGGFRTTNKIVGLVFAEQEEAPRLAIKMARVPEAEAFLRREADILRSVAALRTGGVRGVPVLLFCEERTGVLTLAESAVDGLPVFTHLRPETYKDLALQATDWLVSLAGHPTPCPRARWWGDVVEPILEDFTRSFGPALDERHMQTTREMLANLGDLPLVCEHRDFGPWNVVISSRKELGVLDWEGAELRGLPALDLIYFLAYLAFFLDGAIQSGGYRASYRRGLDPSTVTGSARRECLVRYAAQLGLDPAALGPLALITWLLHARSEYRRFVADAGGPPDPGVLRRSLFVGLWQEELQYLGRL